MVISEFCKKISIYTTIMDNIEDVFVKRGEKRWFFTKSSLKFEIYAQNVEIISITAQIVSNRIQDLRWSATYLSI